jgi:hypothetical protein
MHTKFWPENLKGREYMVDLELDGDNIKMDLKEIGYGGVDWIRLDQDRDQWRAVVNT